MQETPGAALPPPAAPPTSLRPWIIVILVVVVLCCFCVGALGLLFAFGGPVLNELGLLHSQLPAWIL